MRTPQLVLFLTPSGQLAAEAPGGSQTPSRRKLELPQGQGGEWELALRSELLAQRESIARLELLEAQARAAAQLAGASFSHALDRAKQKQPGETLDSGKKTKPTGVKSNFSAQELGL